MVIMGQKKWVATALHSSTVLRREVISSFWLLITIFSWLIVSFCSIILESFTLFAICPCPFPDTLIISQKVLGWKLKCRIFRCFGGMPETHTAAYADGGPPVFSGTRKALGCSISRPDMSQSNCCQVRIFTSSEFLGHRKRPWASIRL